MLTVMTAPSNWASCMCAIADSELAAVSYTMYAVPRLVMNWRFIGTSMDWMRPYEPKISCRCASVTFLVNFSTTILEL